MRLCFRKIRLIIIGFQHVAVIIRSYSLDLSRRRLQIADWGCGVWGNGATSYTFWKALASYHHAVVVAEADASYHLVKQ